MTDVVPSSANASPQAIQRAERLRDPKKRRNQSPTQCPLQLLYALQNMRLVSFAESLRLEAMTFDNSQLHDIRDRLRMAREAEKANDDFLNAQLNRVEWDIEHPLQRQNPIPTQCLELLKDLYNKRREDYAELLRLDAMIADHSQSHEIRDQLKMVGKAKEETIHFLNAQIGRVQWMTENMVGKPASQGYYPRYL